MPPVLGAIADDFTGATDLANTWAQKGLRVVQTIGIPAHASLVDGAEAVVVALKSRTAPVPEAVSNSIEAYRWLLSLGVRQVAFKYCSTFDSTPMGNIGAVADAIMDESGEAFTVVCPAFPANGRTVYQGHLFVGTQLLSESSMKDHPLTPMRDSSLPRLLAQQTSRPVGLISLDVVRAGHGAIELAMADLRRDGIVYAITDAVTDGDLLAIGAAVRDLPFVTGSSGIGIGLPQNYQDRGMLSALPSNPRVPQVAGRKLVVAGSCSAATRRQLAAVTNNWPSRKIGTEELAQDEELVEQLVQWALDQDPSKPVVIYASASPEEIRQSQDLYGPEDAGKKVERVLGAVVKLLHERGFGRIVVAGGETSGAVTLALGVSGLKICAEIAVGVPWCEATGTDRPLAIALKSGNFGGPSFFRDAFGMLHD